MQVPELLAVLVLSSCIASGNKDHMHQVTGSLNQSTELSIKLSRPHPVEIVWLFKKGGNTFKVAEIENNRLKIHIQRFINRLESSSNGTTLRIHDLRMKDSGVYDVQVTFADHEMHQESFSLIVYRALNIGGDSVRGTAKRRNNRQQTTVGRQTIQGEKPAPSNDGETDTRPYIVLFPLFAFSGWILLFIIRNLRKGLIYGPYEVVGLLNQSIKFGPYEVVGLLNQSIKFGPYEVVGLLNQSIKLCKTLDPVDDVVWFIEINEKPYKVPEFKNDLKIQGGESNNHLKPRKNGTMLCIEDLRAEDTGSYFALITCPDIEMHYVYVNLTVYEPVPAPAIRIEGKTVTSDWCNMSLHCSVPTNTSVLSYTWKYRHRETEYQPYNNTGSIIQMSLQPESWNMEFLCIVHNPADQKNDSVRVHEICTPPDEKLKRLYLLFLLVLIVPIVWALSKYYRKDKFEDLKLPTQETDTTASLARELAKAYNPAVPKPRYDTMKGLPEFIDLHKRVDRCQINWETEDNHRNKYKNDDLPVETLCSTTVVYVASQPRSCDYPNQEVVSCTQRQRIQQHRSVEQTDDNHRKEDENEELPEETTCLTANPQTQVEKISIEEQGPL
ncbi:uncharacterized protein LOC142112075 isoform X2 [Mixophyes fleayi]|uniref:uncharacterized protein LOC142112075 isoform X2 n=1 Tax=Mixophyes fleayi TaxID=3061075 RepID=UPI003F4DCE96